MAGDFVLEVCVDSLHGALEAQRGGAARLELCASLAVGGLTPSYGLMKLVRAHVHVPVHVLVRPRPGDFVYADPDLAVMLADIAVVGELGFQGVAIGALTPSRDVDTGTILTLLLECKRFNLSVTFHRAFDCVANPIEAMKIISKFGGISRVLTSGGALSAVEGLPLLRALMGRSCGLCVMPGAGVTDVNARLLVKELGVKEIHGSVRKELRISHEGDLLPGDRNSVTWTVDAEKVRSIVRLCEGVLLENDEMKGEGN